MCCALNPVLRCLLVATLCLVCPRLFRAEGSVDVTTRTVSVAVDTSSLLDQKFLGFGAEWDPKFWADYNLKLGVTEADWNKVVKRIRWMRLPIVRMMMLSRWCTPLGDSRFNWDTPEMRSLYRHLDVCQREGITVVLTDWGCVVEWNRVPGFTGMGDPRYAEAIGKYLDHLIRVKGYTCIRYFVFGNEPNCEGFGWDQWKAGVENVRRVLDSRKLEVVLMGSDQSGGDDWHRRSVDGLSDAFQAWDVHRYALKADVRAGELERYLRSQWDYVNAHDPKGPARLKLVTEAGMADGMKGACCSDQTDTFEYGVFMADYATQATRAGSASVLAWMLDDRSHDGFVWGMWKNKQSDFAFRPWAYPWALLVRYVPAGARLYTVQDPAPSVRVLAAEHDGKWTLCVTNHGDSGAKLNVRIPGDSARSFQQYVYQKDSAPADADGMPVPAGKSAVTAADPLVLECPPQSVVLATTMD